MTKDDLTREARRTYGAYVLIAPFVLPFWRDLTQRERDAWVLAARATLDAVALVRPNVPKSRRKLNPKKTRKPKKRS